jgi:1-acyl-sn-glycerol-3-phosphate acyltransferase
MIISYLKVLLILIHTIICSLVVLIANVFDRSYVFYFKMSRIFARGVFLWGGIRLKIIVDPAIDLSSTYVYVSNHSSMFDIPVIMAAVPTRASIVFKKELARIPVFGWQLVTGPYILVDRHHPDKAMKSIDRAKKMMSEKNISVILFAEGTRSKTGEVQPFKRGAFYLASRVNHPIVPVSISGAEKILPKGRLRIRSGTITITFSAPVEVRQITNKKDEVDLMEKVRQIVIKNKAEN